MNMHADNTLILISFVYLSLCLQEQNGPSDSISNGVIFTKFPGGMFSADPSSVGILSVPVCFTHYMTLYLPASPTSTI